ncbi:DUF5060 domain-containing protein [candidate division KSB1 bacterium]|nr:DUF5060 domain-containing protein [candidate division KSB1 bacterium]
MKQFCRFVIVCLFFTTSLNSANISGELKKWHNVTLTFSGPQTGELATPNPFLDYRLVVEFANKTSGKTYSVPGYYAADGNAANTSATDGNKWRVHCCPDEVGTWNYSVSFRQGEQIAVSDDKNTGSPVAELNGQTGSFEITASDKSEPDLRAKGRLQYIGKRYLRFAETGEYFLKQGADAPENFLAYEDFDNTPNNGNRRKSWAPHAQDWCEGDPTWQDGKGTEIIGAINYLHSEGMNVFSFLTMNIEGDDRNAFPYISDQRKDYTRFDCSKLDQWEIVFAHGEKMGMYLHFKTQETENEMLLDNGDVGVERRLYYRELIARFGHHLALNWNLGEENGALGDVNQSTAQRIAMAQYFYDHDPYHHHIVIHNGKEPDDLLGDKSNLTGYSLQTSQPDFSRVHAETVRWVKLSTDAGKPWVVACDEPGDAQHALVPDKDDLTHDNARRNGLWGNLIGGGGGNEWYFGYDHDHSDLTCQDFRSRDLWWDQCRIALEYFENRELPFWEMVPNDAKMSGAKSWAMAKEAGDVLVYAPEGGAVTVDLNGWPEPYYSVEFFDPRTGDAAVGKAVHGGAKVQLNAPAPFDTEFAAHIFLVEDDTPPTAPTEIGAEALGERKIRITWKEAHDHDSGIGGYIIYRNDNFAGGVGSDVLAFIDNNVRPSTNYCYTTVAINGSGIEGPAAGPVSVTTWEDTHDPELISVSVLTARALNLFFSEEVTKESAEIVLNYSISNGVQVKRTRVADDLKSVRLTTDEHTEGVTYTITVSNIIDLAGRSISPEANSLTYQLSSDRLWLFAEDADLANGAAHKSIDGSLGTQVAFCPEANSTITFNIDIENEGSWYAWGRFMFIGSGNDPNSFFLTVDDDTQQKFGNNKDYFNVWHWDGDGNMENGPGVALNLGTLTVGEHIITLHCREPLGNPGTANNLIDMLYLSLQGDDEPADEIAPTRTTVNLKNDKLPVKFALHNFPNPFNPKTQIQLVLPQQSQVSIDVYDILGQKVDCIIQHKLLSSGIHTFIFDSSKLSSGVYFCKLETESEILVNKMMLLR